MKMVFPGMESPEASVPPEKVWGGTLRPMTARDLDAVAALEALCNTQPWSREALKSCIATAGPVPGRLTCVAESGGVVVGYAIASHVADEGEILILGVHPDARRQGAARALLTALLQSLRAAGSTSVFLEVRRGNAAAIALYITLGFGEAGMRKGYYADTGEDAVLMHVFLGKQGK
jgi:ribosomal-protein-alanine N-acetyltransferase